MNRTNLRFDPRLAGVKVFLFDLWKTLARGPFPEPIACLCTILGLDGRVDDEEFLRFCLTLQCKDQRQYLYTVAKRFGVPDVTEEMVEKFTSLVDMERFGLLWYTEVKTILEDLKAQGYRLGLVTNSWPFNVEKLLTDTGLIDVFEHVIVSAEVGVAKQEGPQIYRLAAEAFQEHPNRMCMVGDSRFDVVPAKAAGMTAVLIDRYAEHVDLQGNWNNPELFNLDIPVIRCLDQLPTANQ